MSSTARKSKPSGNKAKPSSIVVRYRDRDSPSGVRRQTTTRMAKQLGVSESEVVHLALAKLAREILPRYSPDDAPLTPEQLAAIRKLEPQGRMEAHDRLF